MSGRPSPLRLCITAWLVIALMMMPATFTHSQLPPRYAPKTPPPGKGGSISLNGKHAPASQAAGETLLPALKGLVIAAPGAGPAHLDSSGVSIVGLPWLDT